VNIGKQSNPEINERSNLKRNKAANDTKLFPEGNPDRSCLLERAARFTERNAPKGITIAELKTITGLRQIGHQVTVLTLILMATSGNDGQEWWRL
jgi:hypothetical protein